MAVKAGQPQVQSDTQVSTWTYMTAAHADKRSDILERFSNHCGECANAIALK